MSGICGIIHLDGAPVDAQALQRMTEAIAYRGPDGIQVWVEGQVGLAHLALYTTPEAHFERQPLVSQRGDLVLVADARVDNRADLIAILGAKGHLQTRQPTDADLILAAYQCWGQDCPKQIIGDFSFAIWDQKNHHLFCARDPIGVRLLHYHASGSTFIFATNISAIKAVMASSPAINRPFLLDFLDGRYQRWHHETAFEAIFRLPPGYWMKVDSGRTALQRYWVFGCGPDIHFRKESDYIEQFREIFQQAVTDRLRVDRPVGFSVSGGFDSSSIACMADHLIKSGKLSIQGRIYSGVFDHTPAADEKEYSRSVIEHCSSLESTLIPCDDCWGMKAFGRDDGYPLDEPELATDRALSLALLKPMQQDGCRVGLTGIGADEILSSGAYNTLLTVADVKWGRLLVEAGFYHLKGRFPYWKVLAYKLAPERALDLYRMIRCFSQRSKVTDILPAEDWLPAPLLPSQSARLGYNTISTWIQTASVINNDTLSAFTHLEMRNPFYDCRLIDYVLKSPANLLFQGGIHKYILRRAMFGILPEKVLNRTKGAHFTELAFRGVCQEETERIQVLLRDARIGKQGLISQSSIVKSWHEACKHTDLSCLRRFTRAMSVEAWLRGI